MYQEVPEPTPVPSTPVPYNPEPYNPVPPTLVHPSPVPPETQYEQSPVPNGTAGGAPYGNHNGTGLTVNGYNGSNGINGNSTYAASITSSISGYTGNGYNGDGYNGDSYNGNGSIVSGYTGNGSTGNNGTGNGYSNGMQFVRRRLLPATPSGKISGLKKTWSPHPINR